MALNRDSQEIFLDYTEPYNFDALLKFFRDRCLKNIEKADEQSYWRTVAMHNAEGKRVEGWLRVENDADNSRLKLTISDSLNSVAEQITERVSRQFDVDCDPHEVAAGIKSLNKAVPGAVVVGTRMPGAFEPFETACRAVLGQQISVAAANKLAARIVENFGSPVKTDIEGLSRAFPTPEQILYIAGSFVPSCEECGKCEAEGMLPGSKHSKLISERSGKTEHTEGTASSDAEGLEAAFGQLGVIRTRSRTIYEIARLVVSGELGLGPCDNVEQQMQMLMSIKGIGPWTANYIAMRTMAHTDAFLETDIGVKHALPDLKPKERLAIAEDWRPWRGYANICLWNSLG